MSLIYYAYPGNRNIQKAEIAAIVGGVSLKRDESFQMGVDNKKPEFLAKFPPGQVPALDTPHGPVFESNAIARYVAAIGTHSAQLLGDHPYEKAQIEEWIEVGSSLSNAVNTAAAMHRYITYEPVRYEAENKSADRWFGVLESALAGRDHIVLGRLTLADIFLSVTLRTAFQSILLPARAANFPNVTRYARHLFSHQAIKQVFGPVEEVQALPPFHQPAAQ